MLQTGFKSSKENLMSWLIKNLINELVSTPCSYFPNDKYLMRHFSFVFIIALLCMMGMPLKSTVRFVFLYYFTTFGWFTLINKWTWIETYLFFSCQGLILLIINFFFACCFYCFFKINNINICSVSF